MTYTTPGTLATGGTLTHTIFNRDIAANIESLKGQAGTIGIEDAINWCNDSDFGVALSGGTPRWTFDDSDYLEYSRTANQFRFAIAGTIEATLGSTGIAHSGSIYSMQAVEENSHLESGRGPDNMMTGTTTQLDAFTFVKPFKEFPNVVLGIQHSSTIKAEYASLGARIEPNTLTRTGLSILTYNQQANTHVLTAFWQAYGIDTPFVPGHIYAPTGGGTTAPGGGGGTTTPGEHDQDHGWGGWQGWGSDSDETGGGTI